jgi:hypothetical protein
MSSIGSAESKCDLDGMELFGCGEDGASSDRVELVGLDLVVGDEGVVPQGYESGHGSEGGDPVEILVVEDSCVCGEVEADGVGLVGGVYVVEEVLWLLGGFGLAHAENSIGLSVLKSDSRYPRLFFIVFISIPKGMGGVFDVTPSIRIVDIHAPNKRSLSLLYLEKERVKKHGTPPYK